MQQSIRSRKLVLLCLIVLAGVGGCLRGKTHLTIRRDGSGAIEQELTFSDRVVVAYEDPLPVPGVERPNLDEEAVRTFVDDAIEIDFIQVKDQDDGGRYIHWKGSFGDLQAFLNTSLATDMLELTIENREQGRAVISTGIARVHGFPADQGLNLMYGLAKGSYLETVITCPYPVLETNGVVSGKEEDTVTWTLDLRNRKALEQIKAMYPSGDFKGYAEFALDPEAIQFALPDEEVDVIPAEDAGVDIQVTSVRWSKVNNLSIPRWSSPEEDDLDIRLRLDFPESTMFKAYYDPVVVSLEDDQGRSLITEERSRFSARASEIRPGMSSSMGLTGFRAPSRNVKAVQQLKGYVPLVKRRKSKTIMIENLQAVVGKSLTGYVDLDAIGFEIPEIQDDTLYLRLPEGDEKIESIIMIGPEGQRIGRNGNSGYTNGQYEFEYERRIDNATQCEVKLIVEERIVRLPFEIDRIELP